MLHLHILFVELLNYEEERYHTYLIYRRHHYYILGHLSRFQRAICSGFGTGTKGPGQKVPRAKKSLRPAGFEPKTYCLAHGFLTNSPK